MEGQVQCDGGLGDQLLQRRQNGPRNAYPTLEYVVSQSVINAGQAVRECSEAYQVVDWTLASISSSDSESLVACQGKYNSNSSIMSLPHFCCCFLSPASDFRLFFVAQRALPTSGQVKKLNLKRPEAHCHPSSRKTNCPIEHNESVKENCASRNSNDKIFLGSGIGIEEPQERR